MRPTPPTAHRLKESVDQPSEEELYPRMPHAGQREGYVYLIRLNIKRAYKIGRSVDPKDRMRDFMIDMPLSMTLVHAFRADDYHDAEAELQSICKDNGWHLTGEWFDLPPVAVRVISRIIRYSRGHFFDTTGNGQVNSILRNYQGNW